MQDRQVFWLRKLKSTVMLTCNGKSAAATKLMAVMGMGVKHGDPVEVSIEGPDEDTAYEAMERFFQENL